MILEKTLQSTTTTQTLQLKPMLRFTTLLILFSMSTTSDAKPQPTKALPACPDSPNCVSSQAADSGHHIQALNFSVSADSAWQQLLELLKHDEDITRIETGEYSIRAEAHSRVFGFVDDIEFVLWPEQKQIHVRSAARSGYWDLGVNRRRVERIFASLRTALTKKK